MIPLSDFSNLIQCFLFVWVEALRPSQQFFSHVGTEPPLPGYYQYFLGGKCILLKDTTRRNLIQSEVIHCVDVILEGTQTKLLNRILFTWQSPSFLTVW